MCCSLDTEKGTSMTLLYHRIALVSVANKTCTTFYLHLWQEMLMEHICIVNEAHLRIVWQLAMALPEETVMF